jgi:hypothetical protein
MKTHLRTKARPLCNTDSTHAVTLMNLSEVDCMRCLAIYRKALTGRAEKALTSIKSKLHTKAE